MTKNELLKRANVGYAARKLFRKRKNDKKYQMLVERCLKEARNPFYRIFNRIRYKLGLLKIEELKKKTQY